MKKTQVLYKQNVGRMIRRHWFVGGKVKVISTKTEDLLKDQGHEVVDINEFLQPPSRKEEFKAIELYDEELPKNKNHPDFQIEPCFIYRNENVLIEGLSQAKVLTNAVEIEEGLPKIVNDIENTLNLPDEIHTEIKKKIKLCCMFEATQEKLPIKKDPLRPTWIFPRDYGITSSRKNDLLCKNLSTVCEQFATKINKKSIILDAFFSTPLEVNKKKVQFELMSELAVTSKKKLRPIAEPNSTQGLVLPDLYPLDCTISLNPHNFYRIQNIYPPQITSKWPYIQTAFLHFDHTQVRCITEEEISESQIQGRSLLLGFAIAAAQARALYGLDVKKLPEPVVVPVVQTDGKLFHFTVFQLNTLNDDKNSTEKNIFWNSSRIPLYSVCEYTKGRPVLEDYNPDIIRKLTAFYNIE